MRPNKHNKRIRRLYLSILDIGEVVMVTKHFSIPKRCIKNLVCAMRAQNNKCGVFGVFFQPKKITKMALEGGKFSHCLDGMRHNSIEARKSDHCQYCYYQYMNDIPESNREDYPELKQNRKGIQRCLECNVNLCPQCDSLFHGADLSAYSSVNM